MESTLTNAATNYRTSGADANASTLIAKLIYKVTYTSILASSLKFPRQQQLRRTCWCRFSSDSCNKKSRQASGLWRFWISWGNLSSSKINWWSRAAWCKVRKRSSTSYWNLRRFNSKKIILKEKLAKQSIVIRRNWKANAWRTWLKFLRSHSCHYSRTSRQNCRCCNQSIVGFWKLTQLMLKHQRSSLSKD